MFMNEDTPADPSVAPVTMGEIIFDCAEAEFEEKVLKASMERPIIVDFWAPWCGPCKQLMPLLESAVQAAGGEVSLAKINLDENQQLGQMLRVQSVPAVFAFFQGRPVDAFQGVIPESQIKAFIAKLVTAARSAKPEAIDIPEGLKSAEAALASADLETAQSLYAQILEQDESNVRAFVGLVRTMIAGGQIEYAAAMVENAPEEITKQSIFTEAKTALELAQNTPSGESAALQAAVDSAPDNHRARYDLAVAQFAEGSREAALDNLLHIIEADREWNEEAARTQLLKFFEAMGHGDPLTMSARRKLSSILFS